MFRYVISFLILLVSVFCISCGEEKTPKEEQTTPGKTQRAGKSKPKTVQQSAATAVIPESLEFTMIVHDETNESDSGDIPGGEKFFVVQQKLSNGKVAVFVADDHTYSDNRAANTVKSLFGRLALTDTFAVKAQTRIKNINKDQGGALQAKVCREDSLQNKTKLFKEIGLTRGTIVLLSGDPKIWRAETYMGDTLSGGHFNNYQVLSVKRDDYGLITEIWLNDYKKVSTSIEGSGVIAQSYPQEDLNFIALLQPTKTQKSSIDLNKYIGILDSIRGTDNQFPACFQ